MKKYIENILDWSKKKDLTKNDLEYFKNVISFIQHERLIHLIILILTIIIFLISCVLFLIIDNIISFILFIGITLVLIFYIRHYCYLENITQELYRKYSALYNQKD